MTVEGVLKSRRQRRLREWNGVLPALVMVKRNQVTMGTPDGDFLDLPIEAGDVLIIGGID